MDDRLPELVRDWRLDATVADGSTVQVKHISNKATGSWRTRIEEKWDRVRKLGEGGFGVVWLDQCTTGPSAGKVRAVKELKTSFGHQTLRPSILSRELLAFMKFSHAQYQDCFVESFGWYESPESIYITMEYMPLGDLEGYIRKETLPEGQARRISEQLLQGLSFMHRDKYAHRDLKPGNILVQHKGPDWWVKISDFGTTKQIESTVLRTTIGTLDYQAPEVKGVYKISDMDLEEDPGYDLAVDIWAVGAIVFRIVTGRMAFPNQKELSRYVVLDGPFPVQDCASAPCNEFITQTMNGSPRQRPTAREALKHLWIATSPTSETGEAIPSESSAIHDDATAQWSMSNPPTTARSHPTRPPVPTVLDTTLSIPDTLVKSNPDPSTTPGKFEPDPENSKPESFETRFEYAKPSASKSHDSTRCDDNKRESKESVAESKTSQLGLQGERTMERFPKLHRFTSLGTAAAHIAVEDQFAVIASHNRVELWTWQYEYKLKATILENTRQIHAVSFTNIDFLATIVVFAQSSTGKNQLFTWNFLTDFSKVARSQPADLVEYDGVEYDGESLSKAAFVHRGQCCYLVTEWRRQSFEPDRIRVYKGDNHGHFQRSHVSTLNHNGAVTKSYLSPRGGYCILSTVDRPVIWKLDDHGLFDQLPSIPGLGLAGYPLAISPRGRVLLLSVRDELVLYESDKDGAFEKTQTLASENGRVSSCVFSTCGRVLAIGYEDGAVMMLKADGPRYSKETRVFRGHSTPVCALCFSPAATVLVVGSDDQSIAAWEIESGYDSKKLRFDLR